MSSESPSHLPDTIRDILSTGAIGTQKQRMRRKVTRTRAGCLTCKSRRKRCDMVKPSCGDCTRLNLQCEWPVVKRIPKITNPIAQIQSGLSPHVAVVSQEDGVSPERTGHLAPSAPISSPDGLSSSTLHTRWPHAGGDNAAEIVLGTNTFPLPFNSINDAILQVWTESCAPFFHDSVQAVSSDNSVSTPPLWAKVSDSAPSASGTILSLLGESSGPSPDGTTKNQSMQYFQDRLASLLSYDKVLFRNAFHAFNTTASARVGNPARRALDFGILALASRHLFNKGQICFERLSEQLGCEGSTIIMQRLKDLQRVEGIAEEELITLIAGLLIFIMYKICRGDVWSFDGYFRQLKRLCGTLFTVGQAPKDLDSTKFSLLENVVYHESYGCSLYAHGPFIEPEISIAYANSQRGIPNTLTGLALPLYCIVPRVAQLVLQSRARGNGTWVDQELAEIVSRAENIEVILEEERIWLESFIRDEPHLSSHRYFHDAFRICCLLQIKCFVLCQPPDTISVRVLVRKALSLLETMDILNLPGFLSSHWIIFTVSICSALPLPNGNYPDTTTTINHAGSNEWTINDRQRASKLYTTAIDKLAFLNISRSRQIVQMLWEQNQGGRLCVHWLDVLSDLDWELSFA